MSLDSVYLLTEGYPPKIVKYTPEFHIATCWELSSNKERIRQYEEVEKFDENTRIE